MPRTVATKPYDWTYTTTYPGHSLEFPSTYASWTLANEDNPRHTIPLAELTRQDPILYYAEIPLFEDELHDNGSSHLLTRIVSSSHLTVTASEPGPSQRVMPTCFFILSRFTLRVDNVLFRTYDTRIYHSFESSPPLVVRETSGWEAPYDRIKRVSSFSNFHTHCSDNYNQQIHRRNDLTPLTDPNWVAKVLSGMPSHVTQEEGAGTGWRGMGTKVEIAILG